MSVHEVKMGCSRSSCTRTAIIYVIVVGNYSYCRGAIDRDFAVEVEIRNFHLPLIGHPLIIPLKSETTNDLQIKFFSHFSLYNNIYYKRNENHRLQTFLLHLSKVMNGLVLCTGTQKKMMIIIVIG